MTRAQLEKYLSSLSAATLSIQWGDDYVYKVGGKMFAAMGPRSEKLSGLSFKASDESFVILTKQKGINPARYLARARWVQLESGSAMSDRELKAYLARAHAIVAAGLPKKTQKQLGLLKD